MINKAQGLIDRCLHASFLNTKHWEPLGNKHLSIVIISLRSNKINVGKATLGSKSGEPGRNTVRSKEPIDRRMRVSIGHAGVALNPISE